MISRVFVFGTLKEGFPNFGTNRGTRVPGRFRTAQRMPLYLVGPRKVPWLLNQPGTGYQVTGQVFDVDAATLEDMDALEGVGRPDGYRREELEVLHEAEGHVTRARVFAYLKPPEQLTAALERAGPLPEYTLEHAALYRRREA